MAFITIQRGNDMKRIPESVFESQFKNFGYRKIEKSKERKQSHNSTNNQYDDIESVPISEMNREQLRKFAEKYNIDTGGAKNTKEARNMIQRALQERKM